MSNFFTEKEIEKELTSILDEMDEIADAFSELNQYKDRYTDIEYTAKTKVYISMYKEDAYDAEVLKKQLSRKIRLKIWCLRWLRKLLKQKQRNKK